MPVAEWAAFVANWESLGASYMTVNTTMSGGLTGADQHIAALRQAKDALGI